MPCRDPRRVVSCAAPAPCTAHSTSVPRVLLPLKGKAPGMAGQRDAQWWPPMFCACPLLQSPGWARGWTTGRAESCVRSISTHQGCSHEQCPRAHLCRWGGRVTPRAQSQLGAMLRSDCSPALGAPHLHPHPKSIAAPTGCHCSKV